MTSDQKKELKIEIEKRIESLLVDIRSLEETSKPIAPDVSLGRLTRMDAIQQQNMQEAQLNTSKHSLHYLKESLKLLDSDQFGICRFCKKEIGFERIKALPETTKCIQCAEKFGQ